MHIVERKICPPFMGREIKGRSVDRIMPFGRLAREKVRAVGRTKGENRNKRSMGEGFKKRKKKPSSRKHDSGRKVERKRSRTEVR